VGSAVTLILFVLQEDRRAWLSLAAILNLLLALLVNEWLKRRRGQKDGEV
jgi:hypothetical protein